ncbi:MAG: hypothetical protein K0U41_00070 [Gammaproteobacteria bacterium]|nr:hypothetical protein [Gammaproteobacteria bacterium]
MAGILAKVDAFKNATANLHLLSAGGNFPLYSVKNKKGEYDVFTGTWSVEDPTFENICAGKRLTIDGNVPVTAVAPSFDDGSAIAPIQLVICNPQSPDVERRRKACGIDSKVKPEGDAEDEKVMRWHLVQIASCVIGFENLLWDNPETEKTELMPYSQEAVIQFLKDYPMAVKQIGAFLGDTKKFESPS